MTEIHKGPTTEKISSLYRRTAKMLASCKKARDHAVKGSPDQYMLAGKAKAYTEMLCLIHAKYPHHLEAGLWEARW